jgi:hypothetical protein
VTQPHPAVIRKYQRLREVTGSLRTVGTLTAAAHLAWLDPEGVLSRAEEVRNPQPKEET